MESSRQDCDAAWAAWEAERREESSYISSPPARLAQREAILRAKKEKSESQGAAGCLGVIVMTVLGGWGCVAATGAGIGGAILGAFAGAIITASIVPWAWDQARGCLLRRSFQSRGKISLRKPEQSAAHILSAALEDARAQDEMEAMVKGAVIFIVDVAEKARACDEVLARGYYVTWEKGHKALYHHSIDTNWESKRVALVGESEVSLEETEGGGDAFKNDLHGGLLDEIGRFFLRRCRDNRRKADVMSQAVENPAILKRILDEENWL